MGRAPPKPFLSEKHYCCASSLPRPRGRPRPAPSSRPCGLRRGTLSKLFPRYEICLTRNLPNDPSFSFIRRPDPFPTDLSSLQVGWLKADTKAIQAVGDSVITHNPRVSVSHEKLQMHKLHITDVQLDDEGVYMCQLNTSPMKSQVNGGSSEGEWRGRVGHLESPPRLPGRR